jgi:hypothetical protein
MEGYHEVSRNNHRTSTEITGASTGLSLFSAMRGMEDEQTPYSLADLKESFS